MTIACPLCGHGEGPPAFVSRGHLSVRIDPVAAYWRGEKIKMSPMAARILIPLVRLGWAHADNLTDLMRPDTDKQTLYVHMVNLRRALRQAAIPVRITNNYGGEYRLVIDDEDGND